MKAKGVLNMMQREMDDIGRITLPKGMLISMGITRRTPMNVTQENDRIVITPVRLKCKMCNTYDNLIEGFPICRSCAEKVSDLLKLK